MPTAPLPRGSSSSVVLVRRRFNLQLGPVLFCFFQDFLFSLRKFIISKSMQWTVASFPGSTLSTQQELGNKAIHVR